MPLPGGPGVNEYTLTPVEGALRRTVRLLPLSAGSSAGSTGLRSWTASRNSRRLERRLRLRPLARYRDPRTLGDRSHADGEAGVRARGADARGGAAEQWSVLAELDASTAAQLPPATRRGDVLVLHVDTSR